MQGFIDKLKLVRQDVAQDLAGLNLLGISFDRVGDFGCGWGYGTLSLMLELKPSECLGVDQFSGNLDTPLLSNVQDVLNKLKDNLLITKNQNTDIDYLVTNKKLPSFQEGDVITGAYLPENMDLIYCKHVLFNIFKNAYPTNSVSGESAVISVIMNIVHSLKHGGVFVLVEPANDLVNFYEHLSQSGLSFIRMCRIHRGKIIDTKRSSTFVDQDYIYTFLKPARITT